MLGYQESLQGNKHFEHQQLDGEQTNLKIQHRNCVRVSEARLDAVGILARLTAIAPVVGSAATNAGILKPRSHL